MATRSAFGDAMVALGHLDERVVGLDGDVQDSTKMQTFAEAFPDRLIQCFIAEQNMVGVVADCRPAARFRLPRPSPVFSPGPTT